MGSFLSHLGSISSVFVSWDLYESVFFLVGIMSESREEA